MGNENKLELNDENLNVERYNVDLPFIKNEYDSESNTDKDNEDVNIFRHNDSKIKYEFVK